MKCMCENVPSFDPSILIRGSKRADCARCQHYMLISESVSHNLKELIKLG